MKSIFFRAEGFELKFTTAFTSGLATAFTSGLTTAFTVALGVTLGCSSSGDGGAVDGSGAAASGGATSATSGGASGGGLTSSGGAANAGGSTASGGATAAGGTASGGAGVVVSGCDSQVTRNTRPFGCSLAWGTNGNEGNRAEYLDFITTWIGYEHFQGRSGQCDGCGLATTLEGTSARAVYYAYFAGYALDDCNVNPDGPNLCTDGAAWLRDNRELYLELYAEYAQKTYAASPTQGVIWLLEGDFIQYTYEEQSEPLSFAELGALAADVLCAIKTNAPNALVGLNHSTWISNEQASAYWGAMPTELLDFVWTTGVGNNAGYMEPGANSGTYNATTARYDAIAALTGLGLFVDTSFGLSQASDSWSGESAATLNARIGEGVLAVNVTSPPSDYQARLSALRSGLGATCE